MTHEPEKTDREKRREWSQRHLLVLERELKATKADLEALRTQQPRQAARDAIEVVRLTGIIGTLTARERQLTADHKATLAQLEETLFGLHLELDTLRSRYGQAVELLRRAKGLVQVTRVYDDISAYLRALEGSAEG